MRDCALDVGLKLVESLEPRRVLRTGPRWLLQRDGHAEVLDGEGLVAAFEDPIEEPLLIEDADIETVLSAELVLKR